LTDTDYQLLERKTDMGVIEHPDQYDAPTRNEIRASEASERALRICFRMLDGEVVINGRPGTELLYEATRNACFTGGGFKLNPEHADRDGGLLGDSVYMIEAVALIISQFGWSSTPAQRNARRARLRVICLELYWRQKEGKLQIAPVDY